MEGNEELLQKIVDLLLAAGYARAQISSLPPFDKLTGGLAWCITACDVDVDVDFFYDDNATLDYKLKVGEAIEGALQKMACPHPLQVHQIQGLDYAAVYLVVQWLVEHSFTTQEMLGDQVFSLVTNESHKPPLDAEKLLKLVASPSLAADSPLSKDDNLCGLRKDYVVRLHSEKSWKPLDTQSCHQRQAALLKQIAEMEKINKTLQEQRKGLAAQMLKPEEEGGESEVFLETKVLKERVERAGAGELIEKLMPLLEQSKVRVPSRLQVFEYPNFMDLLMSQEEELRLQSGCEQKHVDLLKTIENLGNEEKHFQKRKDHKPDVENVLQQNIMKLKLLRGDMARKNREFLLYRRKLDEVPSQSELMQYERCFVELYLHIQAKLQETRKHFATYNALAEANELTLKEISLLNSIHAQFEEVMTSQGGRTKLMLSMSDIAKGVSQKVEKMEARLLAEQNALSALKKRHSQLIAERRRYDNLMKLFQEECGRNEVLRSSLRQAT